MYVAVQEIQADSGAGWLVDEDTLTPSISKQKAILILILIPTLTSLTPTPHISDRTCLLSVKRVSYHQSPSVPFAPRDSRQRPGCRSPDWIPLILFDHRVHFLFLTTPSPCLMFHYQHELPHHSLLMTFLLILCCTIVVISRT